MTLITVSACFHFPLNSTVACSLLCFTYTSFGRWTWDLSWQLVHLYQITQLERVLQLTDKVPALNEILLALRMQFVDTIGAARQQASPFKH